MVLMGTNATVKQITHLSQQVIVGPLLALLTPQHASGLVVTHTTGFTLLTRSVPLIFKAIPTDTAPENSQGLTSTVWHLGDVNSAGVVKTTTLHSLGYVRENKGLSKLCQCDYGTRLCVASDVDGPSTLEGKHRDRRGRGQYG
jgi:hypothetical protein